MDDPENPWAAYEAGLRWRPYQRRALERFDAHLSSGARRFRMAAPPGAGKTLLGLSMATRVGRRTLVLCPNVAIQSQWAQRLRDHWVCLDAALERFAPAVPVALDDVDPSAPLPTVVVLTYQRLAVTSDGAPHPNVTALLERLRDLPIGVVVADECHHLGGRWGEAVESLLAALDAPFLIGLTATPIEARDGPHARLFGPLDHTVSLPSVVRSGDLAPFQDLCHVVGPTDDETEVLHGNLAAFERLFAGVRTGTHTRESLDVWAEGLELRPEGPDGEPRDLAAWARREPELVAAWARFLTESPRSLPVELPPRPEYQEPLALPDRLLLLAHYLAEQRERGTVDDDEWDPARACLRAWGFDVARASVRRVDGDLAHTLGASRRKLEGMVEILRTEQRHLGEGLRALVLTDYEFPPPGRGLSCVDAMDLLTSLEDVDELDPVLVTGKSFLVDDDLWPSFEAVATAVASAHGLAWTLAKTSEAGYWRVEIAGPDGSSRWRVVLATELLARGTTRCLLSTRALLGEGWDCPALNTLIDLTVVSTPVSVNQIRGRSLRLDPDDDAKVANNWDVLCVSDLGEAVDLERLRRKHQHLHGVTDDGVIERGLGHVHPFLAESTPAHLLEHAPSYVDLMHRRAADRGGARRRWNLGAAYRDEEVDVVTFTPRPIARGRVRASATGSETATRSLVSTPAVPPMPWVLPADHRAARRRGAAWAGGGGLAIAAVATATALVGAPALVLLPTVLGVAALSWKLGAIARARPRWDDLDNLRSLAHVVAVALAPTPQDAVVEVRPREGSSYRVSFPRFDPATAGRAATAVLELASPPGGSRYVITEAILPAPRPMAGIWRRGEERQRAYAVPRSFGNARARKALLAAWKAHRNPDAALRGARDPQARAILASAPYPGVGLHVTTRTIWR